jgi:hypothetical protein
MPFSFGQNLIAYSMKSRFIILWVQLIFCTTILRANVLQVPADYSSIQLAIDAASNGDTILVSPGIYYENVNFRQKKVVLTSHYLYGNDPLFISNTIINGSQPVHRDTASCILIVKGQDASTVVQGFTITGGKGTAWKDEHSSGTYREGGGILVALSSPTIQHNLIIGNEAVNSKGLTGTGGGGIRCGDGSPQILNNVIVNNTGRYGAGIVLNWCGAIIRNNVIAGNVGGEDYGGGGIWINNTNGTTNLIENNTIVNNHSYTNSGGILLYSKDARANLTNNIIWGNTARLSPQVTIGSKVEVSHCNIEGGWTGEGNLNLLPEFQDSQFYLSPLSCAIDAGNTSGLYRDRASEMDASKALFPSMGSTINDMGAYGGPDASILPSFQQARVGTLSTAIFLGNSNVIGQKVKQKIVVVNQSSSVSKIDSVVVMIHRDQLKVGQPLLTQFKPTQSDSVFLEWIPENNQPLIDTLIVYGNNSGIQLVQKISVTGKVSKTNGSLEMNAIPAFHNYPNPFQTSTIIDYTLPDGISSAILTVYSSDGALMKTFKGLHQSGVIEFDGTQLPEGLYFYQLTAANHAKWVNKMLLQR